MSELRDSNFVTELAKGLGIETPIEKEVSAEICSQVEIELRSLIEVADRDSCSSSYLELFPFYSFLFLHRTR